jgi:transposase-like protein
LIQRAVEEESDTKSTVARICSELHERFEAFCGRSLYDVNLVVLFLDAIYLPVRPSGPEDGVICAWGITETGARALASVRLGMREAKGDWLELGRDLTSRGPIASTAPFTAAGTFERSCPSQSTTASASTTGAL